MVRRKSANAAELDIRLAEAVQGVKSGKYKSSYEAAKVLGLNRDTVICRVNRSLSRTQAHYTQQILSPAQESVLLKWIKQLTIGGYSPGHQLLKEVAEEIRLEQIYTLHNMTITSTPTSSTVQNHLPLSQD